MASLDLLGEYETTNELTEFTDEIYQSKSTHESKAHQSANNSMLDASNTSISDNNKGRTGLSTSESVTNHHTSGLLTNYGTFPVLEKVQEPVDYFNNSDKTAIKECSLRMQECDYDPIYQSFYKVDTTTTKDADPENVKVQSISSSIGAVNDRQLQRIFPNLRDLAASSNMNNIKPGLLFRSARPFVNNVYELYEVMCQGLDIRTVIDLRAPDLSANRGEYLSRQMELLLYQAGCSGSATKDRTIQRELIKRQTKAEAAITVSMDEVEEQLIRTKEHWENYISGRKSGLYIPTEDTELPTLKFAREQLTVVDQGLAYCQEGRAMLEDIRNERNKRVLYVVNYFDTPEFHARIQNQLKQPDSLMTVPFLAACKLGDKMLKTNNAEFYFSRFFISDASVQDTYFEMLQTAGGPINDCLNLMLVAEPPILFHCTLGKDRTGLLALFTLHILGASESAIMFDYNLTDYSDLAFKRFVKKFIVGASGLSERFTEATVETMRETIDWLSKNYGSIDGYLNLIGFTEDLRNKLRERFLVDPSLYKSKAKKKKSQPYVEEDQKVEVVDII